MSSWPYDDPPDPSATPPGTPTWECPDGQCTCAPVRDGKPETRPLSILLRDDLGARMGGAKCRIWLHHKVIADDLTADGSGWVKADVPSGARYLYVEWAPSDLPKKPEYPLRKPYIVEVEVHPDEEAVKRRLSNLGFDRKRKLSDNVADYQAERGIEPVTGNYKDVESDLARFHDEGIESPAAAPATQHAFVPARFVPGDSAGGSPAAGGGGNGGTVQNAWDFPTPSDAEGQGKTFHEFQSAGASMKDSNGKEWWIYLLLSRDALKWEVPTATVQGKGVSLAEGQYWARVFQDLTNPDPIIPSGGLDPKRTIRLPSSAENAQKYADATTFTVAALMAQRSLQSQATMPVYKVPSPDPARACLLPTPMILDLRYQMQNQSTQVPKPQPNGGSMALNKLIPDTRNTNDQMNALYTSGDYFVCNPGKFWVISNKLYDNPHKSPVRHNHANGNHIACNYGWYVANKGLAGPTGDRSVDGKTWVIQKPEAGHDILYKDYSQVVILVAGQFVLVDPYTGAMTWEPTRDLYLNQGAVKAAETAHGVQLTSLICAETLPLITASTL